MAKHKTCVDDYTSSVVLVGWAMLYGLTADMAFKSAVRGGHLEVVMFMYKEYKERISKMMHVDEAGCCWTLCNVAASHGQLDCLKYLHENTDMGMTTDTVQMCCMVEVAENGHLECLKYAHDNGCKWSEMTCVAAADGGHLECLKYAHDNGCKWDQNTYKHDRKTCVTIVVRLGDRVCNKNS